MVNQNNKIDLSKLLGFSLVSDRVSGVIDFQDDVVGATCGAKCGVEAASVSQDETGEPCIEASGKRL